MIKLYFFYLYACFKGFFQLHAVEEFLEYSVEKGKNHKLSIKEYSRKLKSGIKKDNPKFEHLYLWLLFSALNQEDPQERSEEFSTILPLMITWWYKLSKMSKDSQIEDATIEE